jgi:hypothetical protein
VSGILDSLEGGGGGLAKSCRTFSNVPLFGAGFIPRT